MKRFYEQLVKGLMVFGTILACWFLLYWIVDGPIVPHPFLVAKNFFKGLGTFLPPHILASFLRVFISSILALGLGLPLGTLMGYKQKVHDIAAPFLYFAYPIPKLALLPIVMLLFGLGEVSKLLMIFIIIFFPFVMDISAGVRNMDQEVFNALRAFGIRNRDIRRRVVLSGLWPTILNSLKISTGIALSILFFAENFGTQEGLGYFVMNSWQKLDYINLYTGIVTLAVIGFLIFFLLDLAEKRCTKWK